MSSDDEKDECTATVEVVGTDIYYYGDINMDSILELNKEFKKLEIELLKKAIEFEGYIPNITLHIHSDGGDFFSGMNAMDHMKRSKVHITTIASGSCCSAATFLLLGGDRRLIGKHGYVLIHQISTGFLGKYEDLRGEMHTCKKLMKMLRRMYKQETSIPKEKLSELMKRDIYLNAEECLKYRVVDAIA